MVFQGLLYFAKYFACEIFRMRNILAKYSCEIFRNLRHDYANCCFGIKLWYFAHIAHLQYGYKKVINMVFLLLNTHLKILELFCS